MAENVSLLLSYMNDDFDEYRIPGSEYFSSLKTAGPCDSYYPAALPVTEMFGANLTFPPFV